MAVSQQTPNFGLPKVAPTDQVNFGDISDGFGIVDSRAMDKTVYDPDNKGTVIRADIAETVENIPTQPLVVQFNGALATSYDAKTQKTLNITPSSIGAMPITGGNVTGPISLSSYAVNDNQVPTLIQTKEIAANEASKVTDFKGYISVNEPTLKSHDNPTGIDLRIGNRWYQPPSAEEKPDTNFPWTVPVWDGVQWQAEAPYTPDAMHTWRNLDNKHDYYYLGDEWEVIDFSGSIFNDIQFSISDGVISLADDAITDRNIAANAAIQQSKIEGLSSALETIASLGFASIAPVITDPDIQKSGIYSYTKNTEASGALDPPRGEYFVLSMMRTGVIGVQLWVGGFGAAIGYLIIRRRNQSGWTVSKIIPF